MGKRKRLLLSAPIVAGLAVVALTPWARPTPPRHRINRHGFEQIRMGMTQADVEGILGVPPGQYRSHASRFVPRSSTITIHCHASKGDQREE